MMYGYFSSSIMGMYSQARSMQNIGLNIANVNTGGYKRVDTHFASLVSERLYNESDLGGIRTKETYRIGNQGTMVASNGELDIAINGKGFFILNSQIDSGGDVYYGRDGAFHQESGEIFSITEIDGTNVTSREGFLADKNGLFVQGYTINSEGVVGNTLQSLRIDNWAFYEEAQGTTEADVHINLPGDAIAGDFFRYSVAIWDNQGDNQTVTFEFTKTDVDNQWTVQGAYAGPPVAQVDTVTLGGTPEAGDVYSVTVDGTTVNYTATGLEADINGVRDALVSALNADATVGARVTAAASLTTGELTLTAINAGTSFDSSAAATDGGSGQVDTVTIGGTVEAGDTYSVTVDGNIVAYTVTGLEADIDEVRDNLVAAINADPTVSALVTAASGTDPGTLTLTAPAADGTFTASAGTTDAGPTADNTAVIATTVTINTASAANTVANQSFTDQTTASTTLTFDGEAQLPANTTISFNNLTFTSGGTASPTFDFSESTQYASDDLVPIHYDRNGNPGGRLVGLRYDIHGVIYGDLDNGSSRALYKIPLAEFSNPEGLRLADGNVYQVSDHSGAPFLVMAEVEGFALFNPGFVELSNVDLADEFSRMIITQNAYNSSATAFRTIDEMTETAKDLIT